MLQEEKLSISEGIDTNNKTSASKKCILCHYWYFKEIGFKFERHVCNKCHDVLMTTNELKKVFYKRILVQIKHQAHSKECKFRNKLLTMIVNLMIWHIGAMN